MPTPITSASQVADMFSNASGAYGSLLKRATALGAQGIKDKAFRSVHSMPDEKELQRKARRRQARRLGSRRTTASISNALGGGRQGLGPA